MQEKLNQSHGQKDFQQELTFNSAFVDLLDNRAYYNFLFKCAKSREIIVQFSFSRDFFGQIYKNSTIMHLQCDLVV